MRDDDFVSGGTSFNMSPSQRDVVFRCVLGAVQNHGGPQGISEEFYTRRSEWLIEVLGRQLGGDWMVVCGHQVRPDETPIGFYVPAVRSVTFLVHARHLFHVAQVFEPRSIAAPAKS